MFLDNGFVYRFGVSVKEAGERMARIRLFGIPVLRPFSGLVTGLGYAIRERAMSGPARK
jgi:hypothetical protein